MRNLALVGLICTKFLIPLVAAQQPFNSDQTSPSEAVLQQFHVLTAVSILSIILKLPGFCGFSPSFCTPVDSGSPCTSNCDALAECGLGSAPGSSGCPLNVCCSQNFAGSDVKAIAIRPGSSRAGPTIGPRYIAVSVTTRDGPSNPGSYPAHSRIVIAELTPPAHAHATSTLPRFNFAFALISDVFQIIEMTPGDAALWTRTTGLKKRNAALKCSSPSGGGAFRAHFASISPLKYLLTRRVKPTQQIFSNLVGSAANTNTFISSTLQTLQTYGFDRIGSSSFFPPFSSMCRKLDADIDWEYPGADDRGGVPADTPNFTTFMAAVLKAFGSTYGLTFTAPSSYWYLQHFDLPGLLKSADWVNVITYDLHGTWDGVDPYIGAIVRVVAIQAFYQL
ncbi:glycoside hydrolase superfamily [Mycena vulgaris]|nr:glycoside hydrolase superfamily [Mycena vulgaris]